jgi:Phytochelatin synthase
VLTARLVLGKRRSSDACPTLVLRQQQQLQDSQEMPQKIEEHPPTTTKSNSSGIIYLNHSFAYSLLQYNKHADSSSSQSLSSYLPQQQQQQHCRETHADDHNDHDNFFSRDYFLLQQGLDAQKNQAYCAVATAAAILNSLRHATAASRWSRQNSSSSTTTTSTTHHPLFLDVSLPVDFEYDPYPYATQDDLFNECTSRTVIADHHDDDEGKGAGADFDGILAAPYGLGLLQTKALLECHLLLNHDGKDNKNDGNTFSDSHWTVEAHHVDSSAMTLDQVRLDLIEVLTCPLSRVAVNFDRSILGQEGQGHWSPVASYAPSIDAFLILDVAKYKSPSFWVSTTKLYESMATRDDCGQWNYPMAQNEMLENDEFAHLLHPHSSRNWRQAMQLLQCQSTFRGYLIVKPKDGP